MKIFKKIIITIILLVLIVILIIAGIGYYKFKTALSEMPLAEKISGIVSDANYTEFEELPTMYKNAVVAVEDHRFYKHSGIDIISICRAIYVDVTTMSLREGGSTITQQLAKNLYFTQERSLSRKFAEVFMAFEIEKNYEKDEILELYVNTSYFGDGYYNIKEASNGYFEKEPNEMNDYESTLLAGVPNAPSVYAPTQNLDLAQERQKQVLNRLVKYEYITEEEAEEISLSAE